MKRVNLILAALALLLVVAICAPAIAVPTAYSDRPTFLAAVQSTQTITFEAENLTPSGFTYYGGGLTSSGVLFTGPAFNYLYVADGNAVSPAYDWGSGASLLFGSTNESGQLEIDLPSGTSAVGLDFMVQADELPQTGVAAPFTFTVNGTDVFNGVSLLRPNRAFFGVTSDVDITNITITMTNPAPVRALPIIDNVTFEIPVPEPSSFVLLGLGFIGMMLAGRRRKM